MVKLNSPRTSLRNFRTWCLPSVTQTRGTSLRVSRAHSGFFDSWRDSQIARTVRVLCSLGGWRATMARAYSQDLRDRVIDAALGGMPARRAGGPFASGGAPGVVLGGR